MGGKKAISRAPAIAACGYMRSVDRRPDDGLVLERVFVLFASPLEPAHQVGDRRNLGRHLDLLLVAADPLAYPGEIDELATHLLIHHVVEPVLR